jgi:hypothetical protein
MSYAQPKRIYWTFNPPVVEKCKDALKFGILGAANSADWALLNPAKLHPEVVVYAIAAHGRKRVEEFARKNRALVVHDSYRSKCRLDHSSTTCRATPNSEQISSTMTTSTAFWCHYPTHSIMKGQLIPSKLESMSSWRSRLCPTLSRSKYCSTCRSSHNPTDQ